MAQKHRLSISTRLERRIDGVQYKVISWRSHATLQQIYGDVQRKYSKIKQNISSFPDTVFVLKMTQFLPYCSVASLADATNLSWYHCKKLGTAHSGFGENNHLSFRPLRWSQDKMMIKF